MSRPLLPKTHHHWQLQHCYWCRNLEKVIAQIGISKATRKKPYNVRYDQVNAILLNEFLKEHRKVEEQGAMIARQQKQIEALTAGLQKVSAQFELNKSAPQTVLNAR